AEAAAAHHSRGANRRIQPGPLRTVAHSWPGIRMNDDAASAAPWSQLSTIWISVNPLKRATNERVVEVAGKLTVLLRNAVEGTVTQNDVFALSAYGLEPSCGEGSPDISGLLAERRALLLGR